MLWLGVSGVTWVHFGNDERDEAKGKPATMSGKNENCAIVPLEGTHFLTDAELDKVCTVVDDNQASDDDLLATIENLLWLVLHHPEAEKSWLLRELIRRQIPHQCCALLCSKNHDLLESVCDLLCMLLSDSQAAFQFIEGGGVVPLLSLRSQARESIFVAANDAFGALQIAAQHATHHSVCEELGKPERSVLLSKRCLEWIVQLGSDDGHVLYCGPAARVSVVDACGSRYLFGSPQLGFAETEMRLTHQGDTQHRTTDADQEKGNRASFFPLSTWYNRATLKVVIDSLTASMPGHRNGKVSVLALGVGGGAFIRALFSRCKNIHVVAVEKDAEIIHAGNYFGDWSCVTNDEDQQTLQIEICDAEEYVLHTADLEELKFAAIVVDLYHAGTLPSFMASTRFWQQLASILNVDGVTVINAGTCCDCACESMPTSEINMQMLARQHFDSVQILYPDESCVGFEANCLVSASHR